MHSQTKRRVTDFLSAEEIRELTTRSDARGFVALATSWSLIFASFALVGLWPNVLTLAVALVVLGGRQLALSVLMHDAAHRSLFASPRFNRVLGEWLCAAPTWNSTERYRKHHLQHHAHTNEDSDPDLPLVANFPVTRASLARKFARDLLGPTAIKRVLALLAMDFGLLHYSASPKVERADQSGRSLADILACGARNLGPVLVTNFALYLILRATGHGELYWLWPAAYLTTFNAFLRVRSMAEHACTTRTSDPFFNTRTTKASLLARLTVAPHAVHYHLEHHLLPTVPLHALPRMHQLLRERGALEGCHLSPGYLDVLRAITDPRNASDAPA